MSGDMDLDNVLKAYSSDPFFLDGESLTVNSVSIDGDYLLHRAVSRGDLRGVSILIQNGAYVNSIGDMGNTPLHYAAERTEPEFVLLLLESGADRTIMNEFKKTASEWADSSGNPTNAKLIRDH
jgi:uncharacterized protein